MHVTLTASPDPHLPVLPPASEVPLAKEPCVFRVKSDGLVHCQVSTTAEAARPLTGRLTSTAGAGGGRRADCPPGDAGLLAPPGPTQHHGRRETPRNLTVLAPGHRAPRGWTWTGAPWSPSARTPQSDSPSPGGPVAPLPWRAHRTQTQTQGPPRPGTRNRSQKTHTTPLPACEDSRATLTAPVGHGKRTSDPRGSRAPEDLVLKLTRGMTVTGKERDGQLWAAHTKSAGETRADLTGGLGTGRPRSSREEGWARPGQGSVVGAAASH